MATSRDYDELLRAWQGWRDVSGKLMKDDYVEFVTLSNEAINMSGMYYYLILKPTDLQMVQPLLDAPFRFFFLTCILRQYNRRLKPTTKKNKQQTTKNKQKQTYKHTNIQQTKPSSHIPHEFVDLCYDPLNTFY